MPIRFEEVSATVGEDDGAVVRAQWRRAQQTLLFEVPLGASVGFTAVMEITLGYYPEGPNSGENPAFRAIDLVQAVALSHWPALTPARQVEVFREYISGIAAVITGTLTCATPVAEVAVPGIATLTLLVSSIVPVPHFVLSTSQLTVVPDITRKAGSLPSMNSYAIGRNEPLALLG